MGNTFQIKSKINFVFNVAQASLPALSLSKDVTLKTTFLYTFVQYISITMTTTNTKFEFKCTEGFKKIYSGFSGGADSTALLIALAKEAEKSGFELEAVHFEHGIRGDASRADADWCRRCCEIRKIPFRQIDLEIDPDIKNLEATARKLRLEAWRELVDPESEAVAVGHHADDRIENIFLRMMRGSNATGLTSMRSSQKVAGITFIRPMIGLRRVEIEEFLKESGVEDWRTDHTNFENIYRRNFIRNEVIPLIRKEFPDADKALLKSISALEADAVCLEQLAMEKYAKLEGQSSLRCPSANSEGEARFKTETSTLKQIDIEFFADLSPAIQARILRLWLTDSLGSETIPTADFLNRFTETIAQYDPADGKQILIPLEKNIALAIEKGILSITSTDTDGILYHTIEWNWLEQPTIKWDDSVFTCEKIIKAEDDKLKDPSHLSVYFAGTELPDKLIIRNRIPGDKMIPFAKNREVKIKKLLQNTDLRIDEKKNIPIIATPEGQIIWVPGVRRANFANISGLTIDIICFSYKTIVS
jgi:tRNA(Ile)-lysidine synthase